MLIELAVDHISMTNFYSSDRSRQIGIGSIDFTGVVRMDGTVESKTGIGSSVGISVSTDLEIQPYQLSKFKSKSEKVIGYMSVSEARGEPFNPGEELKFIYVNITPDILSMVSSIKANSLFLSVNFFGTESFKDEDGQYYAISSIEFKFNFT